MNEMQMFNSIETAKLLGVNVSTVKRWTDAGILKCTKTAGGHRKFMMMHIADFVEQNQDKVGKIQAFPIESEQDIQLGYYITKGDFEYLTDFMKQQALSANRQRVQQVLNGLYLANHSLHSIYDHVVAPVLRQIGELWEKDVISVTEEHLATQTIKDSIIRLQGILRLPDKRLGIVFCLNLRDEMHDIPLKMVDHVLELRGFKVLNSGQNTPLHKIEQIFENYAPRRLYISSTYVPDPSGTEIEFKRICDVAQLHNVDVYVGGVGLDRFEYDRNLIKRRLFTFEEVYEI